MDGYKPRLGDQRIGYFTTSFKDHSDSQNADPTVNYIYRWRLEKQHPKAALSPPKKPIVFYIDNAMPIPYRKAASEGLLLWNKAFEKVGIKDAIVVKQMPDDADWDIADVRYNVVRWTVNVPFAIALMRASPITGEILNASINFDSGFASEGAIYNETLQDFDQPASPAPLIPGLKRPASLACEYPAAAATGVGFAAEALDALQPQSSDEKQRLIYEYIRHPPMSRPSTPAIEPQSAGTRLRSASPEAPTKRTPRAPSAPRPRSCVALPPTPSRIARAPAAAAARIRSPVPVEEARMGSRIPAGPVLARSPRPFR